MNEMEAFRESIRRCGLKQSEIATQVGISAAYLSDILKGKRDGTAAVRQRIAEVLRQKEAAMPFLGSGELAAANWASVPFCGDLRLAAGVGATVDEAGLEALNRQVAIPADRPYLKIDPATETDMPVVAYAPALARNLGRDRAGTPLTLSDLENLRAFRVGGDSMEPLLARDGIVVVDLKQHDVAHIENRGLYVLTTDQESGEFKAKRLSWAEKGRTVAIESENKAYKTEYRRAPEITLLGKIIWAWRDTF